MGGHKGRRGKKTDSAGLGSSFSLARKETWF